MGRNRTASEQALRAQVERMAHRSATVSQLVAQSASPLDVPGWLLLRLVDTLGPVRSSDLAARSRLSRPSVSRCLAGLERAGLVTVSPDPDDGRAALVQVTAEGGTRLEHIAAVSDERIHEITHGFTADEVEILARLLTRFNDNADDVTVDPAGYTLEKANR